jgi:glycosyltransferase involved in cell wall biosynthesis
MTRRIAVIAPPFFTIPPVYGGVEEVVANLVRGLLDGTGLEHDYEVVLFAANGSGMQGAQTVNLFDPYFPTNPVEWAAYDEANTAVVYNHIYSGDYGHFDVVSDHTVPGPAMAYARASQPGFIPSLITLHNTLPSRYLPAFLSRFPVHAPLAYAAIAQHELLAAQEMGINPITLCYNGENVEALISEAQTVQKEGEYFSFIARIHPDKDVVRACFLALEAGVNLRIAGRINDRDYFLTQVQPLLNSYPEQLRYVGEIASEEKVRFLAGSQGFIFPVLWSEGFGMSIVQAWACGLPVIGSRNGSLPELLDPAPEAGLASEDEAAMVSAIREIARNTGRYSQEACFARARDFSVERMTKAYENAFNVLLNWD